MKQPEPTPEQPESAARFGCTDLLGRRSLAEQLTENTTTGMWIIANPKTETEQLMTGAVRAGIRSDGLVKVLYEDGEEETREATQYLLTIELEKINLMYLVGFVQNGRKSA